MKNIKVNEKLLKKVTKAGTALVLVGSMVFGNPIIPEVENNIVHAEEMVNLNTRIGINLYLDDKGFVPRDVNGNEVTPFIYEGTTYVPIRAIAELFNANISWDNKTNTVSINTIGESPKLKHTPRITQALIEWNMTAKTGVKLVINGKECIPKDVNGNIKDIYIINGTTYVPVRAVSEELGLPITWGSKTNSVFIGKHKTEGLTVENIDSPEVIRDAVNSHFIKKQLPLMLGYVCDNKTYNIISSGLEEYIMTLVLLNIDYISDETLLELVGHLDNETLSRYLFAQYQIPNFLVKLGDDWFDWEYVAVDPNVAQYLTRFVKICECCYEKDDRDAIYYKYLERFNVNAKDNYIDLPSSYIDFFMFDAGYACDDSNAFKREQERIKNSESERRIYSNRANEQFQIYRLRDDNFYERLNNAKKNVEQKQLSLTK